MHFEAAHHSAGAARRFVRAELAGAACDLETAELLVSELATNAVGHGGSAFDVSVDAADRVRVAVHDDDPSPLSGGGRPDPEDERGRGLFLVEELSIRWGVEQDAAGKTVWFEL